MSSSQQSTSTTGRFPAQRRLLTAMEKNGPDSSDARVPMNTHEKYGDFPERYVSSPEGRCDFADVGMLS